ncbi:glycerophosphodiester phosphodiesterase family protein [Nitrosomonas sp. HPC101]|uniref:glycerophosphodiester phosphodiesterase family protein n=1 Tax=Nitrosomonas sp. HPC101 TaxID=1658667 RepID=UPI001F042576|nr:glycerophosphodiester phosphodiesterase family protein [Nitrosomonas sp. HPC101]
MKIQLGPRPFFLVNDMDEGALKNKLLACEKKPSKKSDFSIGHRGAALQFPEHTRESYLAAARMGAGIIECDVTFTQDEELVCRHSQCDLHTTTNILTIPELAEKCSESFTPAEIDPVTGEVIRPATARCCTSDITLTEFKTLTGKMDASNPRATTIEEYLDGTPSWRTDLYAGKGTLMTHKESIELFKQLGVKMTPELKSASVTMPFQGHFSQQDYAQKMINEYREADVNPANVYPQSFNRNDILYWIQNEPDFGKQAVYLDDRYETLPGFDHTNPATWKPGMEQLAAEGIQIIAPPIPLLLTTERNGRIIPSAYATAAREAGLDIITWTLERSGPLAKVAEKNDFYYQSIKNAINNDGDVYTVLDVLARQVGILGMFSDWPATTTYYANCMNIQ